MADTRNFKSLGENAKNADEVQQPNTPVRVPGDAYRNTEYTAFQQNIGKQFNIVPVSEDVNQQLNNASKFTNLIDRTGIPGWRFDVVYDMPAVVWGSDDRLYKSIQNGNINVDPAAENPYAPEWWGEFVTLQEIGVDLSSQVPGDEGAKRVGATFTPFFNAAPEGQTLQDSLEYESNRLYKMNNLKVLAQLTANVNGAVLDISGPIPVTIQPRSVDIISQYNIDSFDPTLFYLQGEITETVTQKETFGYFTINFSNPISTPYIYISSTRPNGYSLQSVGAPKPDFYVHANSNVVADASSTSIKIGQTTLMNRVANFGNYSEFGFEDGIAKANWNIDFTAYIIDV